ncbi:glycosyltransferase [Opitutaceae bacterium]|nr:glycosyltransferase [Opitutaceae bacterium]
MADMFVQSGLPGRFNDYRFASKLPEFFALGRPVILPASNLGQSVRHGNEACVLPQADAEDIAAAIAPLRADPKLMEIPSEGAKLFAREHFSWPRSAARLQAFYCSLTPLP